MVALIVVAVIIGKPLSYLKCGSLRLPSSDDSDSSAFAFTTHLSNYLNKAGGKISYIAWIGASKSVCLEGKAIWGLCIALWYVVLLPFLRAVLMLTCAVFCFSSPGFAPSVCGRERRARLARSWMADGIDW